MKARTLDFTIVGYSPHKETRTKSPKLDPARMLYKVDILLDIGGRANPPIDKVLAGDRLIP